MQLFIWYLSGVGVALAMSSWALAGGRLTMLTMATIGPFDPRTSATRS
jgi:hypothetical protein